MHHSAAPGTRIRNEDVHWAELAAIIGQANVREATAADPVDGVQPQMVAEPATTDELAGVLRWASAAEVAVIPRGSGTKLNWGNPPARADLVLSTRRLNRVVEHASGDMTATVEAGCTIASFQRALAQHGQRLALDPLDPERATIGGVLATNDSGALRTRFGGLRDLIIGITLVLPDGTIAKSGGKVVKNVAGYDLPKLATGSLGTLGVIAQAIFRLHPLPRASRTLSFTMSDYRAMNALILSILGSTLVPTGVQIRASAGAGPQVDIRFEGVTEGIDAQCQQLARLSPNLAAVEASGDLWNSRDELWKGKGSGSAFTICKFSVLPAEFAATFETLGKLTANHNWSAVAQANGLGWLRLKEAEAEAAQPAETAQFINAFRSTLEREGGSVVVLECPRQVKSTTDVWGPAGDALPLMQRVKLQLDPANVLNPGRFIGGI
jgi:glycolate oxidase FAD binding subunit